VRFLLRAEKRAEEDRRLPRGTLFCHVRWTFLRREICKGMAGRFMEKLRRIAVNMPVAKDLYQLGVARKECRWAVVVHFLYRAVPLCGNHELG